MKHTLIALFVLATACTSTDKPKQKVLDLSDSATRKMVIDSLIKQQKTVESKTVVTYPLSINTNEFGTGLAFKIGVDTLMPGDTKLTHYDFYRVAVNVNKTDSLTGVMLKDSIGRQMIDVRWIDMAEKAIIFDYKKDWQTYLDAQKK